MQDDLQQMNDTAKSVTGLTPKFFRPPYGVTNPNLKKAVEQGNYTSIGWNVRSLDTVIRDENRLLRSVLKRVKPGSILLFHDTSETTVKILRQLISRLRENGYVILRLDKLIKLEPYA